MSMDKLNLRIKYLKIRKSIENKAFLSDIIANNVLNSHIYSNSKNIGIYVGFDEEVSTKKLILQCLANKKCISVPVVEENKLSFYNITNLEDLCNKSPFGIQEPIPCKDNLTHKNSLDLLIVPGICFDINGNRIGYGKRIL